MCIRCLVAKGVSRDARNMEGHIRQWNAGLRGRYSPFLVAQWSVVRVESRDISRQGNVVRSTKTESRAQVDTLDCTIGRMFPVSPTSGYPLFKLYKYYKLHNFMVSRCPRHVVSHRVRFCGLCFSLNTQHL